MHLTNLRARLSALLLSVIAFQSQGNAEVITFDSLTVPAAGFYNGNVNSMGPERDRFNVVGTRDSFGSTEFLQEWTIDGVTFNNNYTDFGTFDSWSGWSYSSVQNSVSPGFTNQYAARPGGGAGGSSTYLVAFGSGAFFDVPVNRQLESVALTNTTYAARYIADGTDGFGNPDVDLESKYGGPSGTNPDYFRVVLSGYTDVAGTGNLINSITIDLANYESANSSEDFVITEWMDVALSSIADARSVVFDFETNDIGPFGPDTPFYVALDNLGFVAAVPEPNSFAALVIASLAMGASRRTRRSANSTQVDIAR